MLFNNFSASTNFMKSHVNKHLSQLIYDNTNLFDNFNILNIFLTTFNSSDEFEICLGIPYHMESSLPICNINPLTRFYIVGVILKTDCNFNFNTDVNVTVDSYMNSSFNFSFLHLLKIFTCF